MDTLLSQLVCSVVALLVYKYVETVQEEAPGSYTWPHRSSLTILIRPKEILIKVFKHQPSNVQFKFMVKHLLLSLCWDSASKYFWPSQNHPICQFQGRHNKRRITSDDKENTNWLSSFLLLWKKKSTMVSLSEGSKGLKNIIGFRSHKLQLV